MNRYSRIILLSLSGLLSQSLLAALPQVGTGETNGYKLVWQDLFNGNELNPERWNIEVNGNGNGNNELQYYREENVTVGDDGEGNNCMIITARRENYMGKSFTSGRVTTQNRFAFKHGKIEAAIKFPTTANGLWPAFWMMGNDYGEVGWPRSGETDIVEMGHIDGMAQNKSDRFFNGAMHWGQGWPAASYAKTKTLDYSLQDGKYHIFTTIWDEDAVSMYVDLDQYPDQEPYFKMTIPCDDPTNEWSPGNYFHKENFVLFNLAVGGDFTGIHDAGRITALNDENGQEARMMVNYVRVYQKGTSDESMFCINPGDEEEMGSVARVVGDDMQLRVSSLGIVCSDYCRMSIISMTGMKVFDAEVAPGEVSLPNLAGVYVAKAITRDGRISTLKFVR